ncbi:aspartic peptidase domain-containing protein [Suillus placidus]|uniref:Aspartic peptidase domain-containing protein n=1 Tax=Suillus placidus TaxID=48579 RepID=A0A9P7A0G6_9AGAM|nr:aspartic peptidase domain-containing protein [Suillus placidus]
MIIAFQYRSIMFPAASLLTTLLLALSIAASPVEIRDSPITLPITRRLNTSGGTINLLQRDQSRATALKTASRNALGRRAGSIPVTNDAVIYIAAVGVGVGSPATTYNLIVDTGSSNAWVDATTPYAMTSTSVNTCQPVVVSYGSGSFSGTVYTNTVTLGSGLTITQQSIGVASTSTGFTGVDGYPDKLTGNDDPNRHWQPVSQGTISHMVVGVAFEPTTSHTVTNGELTFGGIDATKYTGPIAYTPLTTTYPASYYWGINESITYVTTTISSAGIVDTGTTLILIASSAGLMSTGGLSGMLAALAASGFGPATPIQASKPAESSSATKPASETPATGSSEIGRRRSLRLSAKNGGPSGDKSEGSSATAPTIGSVHIASSPTVASQSTAQPMEALIQDGGLISDFTGDEVDAEVFEDDDDIDSAADKTVTLSIADGGYSCNTSSDGSKVEAQTPDGTRVATPNRPMRTRPRTQLL